MKMIELYQPLFLWNDCIELVINNVSKYKTIVNSISATYNFINIIRNVDDKLKLSDIYFSDAVVPLNPEVYLCKL